MTLRYLPIQTADGQWIHRVDLYLLARIAFADTANEREVDQLYDFMCRSNSAPPALNALETDVRDRFLGRDLRHRMFAGHALLEFTRITALTGKPPSLTRAVRLTAYNQRKFESRKASAESLERDVRRGLSDYRNTLHLQAALVMGKAGTADFENSETNTRAFLASARGLELFVDSKMVGKHFAWNPWRIPMEIEPNFKVTFSPLSAEELRMIC